MTSDIAIYEGGQLDGYRPQIMTPEAALELDKRVRACTKAVLREGTDFGKLPGTDDRHILFKPGAEKLLQWFGLAYRCDQADIDLDDEGRKAGVTYRATVFKRIGDPARGLPVEIATCDGYAGYDEDKFYQSAEQAQFKAEAKERYWAEKDRRPPNPNKWKHVTEYRAPWNTVLKMAQKRAIVGAVINATAAGGLFTDDDSRSDAPADGGPSWFQQALGEAGAVRSKEEGDKLSAEAEQAAADGLCTPAQASAVQSRIRQRLGQLAPVQVEVEDLAEGAAAAAGEEGPQQGAGFRARNRSPRAAGAGGAKSPAQVIAEHLDRLGADTDRAARLRMTGIIAGRAIASTSQLPPADAARVIRKLDDCKTGDDLERLLTASEQDQATEATDGH